MTKSINASALPLAQYALLAPGNELSINESQASCLEVIDGVVGLKISAPGDRSVASPIFGPGDCIADLEVFRNLPARVSLNAIVATKIKLHIQDSEPCVSPHGYRASTLLTDCIDYHQRSAFEIVARIVAKIAKCIIDDDRDGRISRTRLAVQLTQERLAELCALSRRSVCIELQKLSEIGWADCGRGRLVIQLPHAWAEIARMDIVGRAAAVKSIADLNIALDKAAATLMKYRSV